MRQFDSIVITQGHYLARQIMIVSGTQKLFTATVDTIQLADPKDPLFTPPADAVLRQTAPPVDGRISIASGVAVGQLLQKTQPIYPAFSKSNREQGTVVLAAVIGVDGNIHNLEVLTSPSPNLSEAALDAVKTWKYKPYLLNGVPVEVETTINVIFSFGG
jgi:TonB family protein